MAHHLTEEQKVKVLAASDVVADSWLYGWTDIAIVRRILPLHYEVENSKEKSALHCVSKIGIRKGIDSEDDEHWEYIMQAFKAHFKERFQEVFCNVCFCYTDFTIYFKPKD